MLLLACFGLFSSSLVFISRNFAFLFYHLSISLLVASCLCIFIPTTVISVHPPSLSCYSFPLAISHPASLFSSLLALSLLGHSVSLAQTPHQQQPYRPSRAKDVYFMLLSYDWIMTLNCFICLTSLGPGANAVRLNPMCQPQTGTGAKRQIRGW